MEARPNYPLRSSLSPVRRLSQKLSPMPEPSAPSPYRPQVYGFPWDRVAGNSSQPGMSLAADPRDAAVAARHPALADQHGAMFSATFNPAQAEKLFAGTGHTFAELLTLADGQNLCPTSI